MVDHNGWMQFGGGFMWLFWIVGLLVVLFFLKMLFTSSNASSKSKDISPLDILKARYARGEISAEEYNKIKKELE